MEGFSRSGLIREVIELASVGSTNTYALDGGRPGLLVSASTQTAGRGRKGRSWFSPPDANLYFTLTIEGSDPRLSLAAGVAVREALQEIVGPEPKVEIKWPNDLIIGARKVCGILCESRSGITAIVIGINVNQRVFPPELESTAGSLSLVLGRDLCRLQVLGRVVASLDEWLQLFLRSGFEPVRRSFLDHGLLDGHRLLTEEGEPCRIMDLHEDGQLLISVAGRLRKIVSGSILLER